MLKVKHTVFTHQVSTTKSGKLPTVRDIKIDESIHLKFEVPKNLSDKQATKWINKNAKEIVGRWEKNAKGI